MSNNIKPLKSALSKTYAIERELGAGGMATVYLAEDVKHRRKVAVKVLHPALAETMPTIPGRYGRRTDKRSCFRKPMQPVLAFGSFRILVAPLPDRYSTRRPTNSTRHCRPTVNGWLTFLTKVVRTKCGCVPTRDLVRYDRCR